MSGDPERPDDPGARVSSTPARFSADGLPLAIEPRGAPTDAEIAAHVETLDPNDKKAELQIAIIVGLKLAGKTQGEIVKLTGLKPAAIKYAIRVARARKLLATGIEEAVAKFQNEAVPAAIEGFQDLIESGDKQAIFKALDGAGITATKDKAGHTPALPALAVNIIMPPGVTATPGHAPGTAVGRPLTIDVIPETAGGA